MSNPISHISHTSVSTYQDCPRLWWFKYVDRRPVAVSYYRPRGIAFHAALRYALTRKKMAGTLPSEEEVIRTFTCTWEDECNKALPDGRPAVTFDGRDPAEIVDETSEMLLAYLRGPAQDIDPVLVETRLEFNVADLPIPFVAYIDVVARDGLVIDHKTTSGNGWSQDRADADQQVDAYWLAYTMRFGRQPKEFRFDVVTPPKISEPAEVERMRKEKREVLKLGDFYFVELKSGQDNLKALGLDNGSGYAWDAESRAVAAPDGTTLTIPFPRVKAIRCRYPSRVQSFATTRTTAQALWYLRSVIEVYKGIQAGVFPPRRSWKCGNCEYAGYCAAMV